MTTYMSSAHCQAMADWYKKGSYYPPFPDEILLSVDISSSAYLSSITTYRVYISTDGSSYSSYSSGSVPSSGIFTITEPVSNPSDYNRHSYRFRVDFRNSSATVLQSDYAINSYSSTSSRYYYMKGQVAGAMIVNTFSLPETYPLVQPSSSSVFTYSGTATFQMSSSYSGGPGFVEIVIKHSNQEYSSLSDGSSFKSWMSGFTHTIDTGYYAGRFSDTGNYKIELIFKCYTSTVLDSNDQFVLSNYGTYSWDVYIYEQVAPTFKIQQVYSTGYGGSSGYVSDVPPYEGKAPYIVVWEDTTKETNPYAVPQQTIVWNFGDPESGSDNQATQTNSSSSIIKATTQLHEYPDYDRYQCTMTVTDKLGNTLSSTQSFSPSTKQRQFNSPTLTPLTGTQPLLCTGTADITGSPEPVPTWTYTLQGTSSSPYSGTVSGKDVEISLLKEGTYSVVYSVSLEGTTTTTTFTATVSAGTVTTDDSQTMHDFDLIVLDSSGNAIDWCKQHSSIQYIEYYQDLDVFSFEIPETYAYAQYLQEGNYLILGYKGYARLMQVTYRGRNNGTITISGESAFPERVAITATRSTANDGYDVQTCNGEALIRYFVTTCLTDPYPDTTTGAQPRGADFVVFGADQGRPTGESTTYSARYDKLRDIINDICKASNLGYTITARQSGLTKAGLTIVEGTDRTYSYGGSDMVVFSPKRLKNCIIESDQSALSRNVSIGAGEGVGNYRSYSYYGQTSTTGFNRREMFTDAGDSANSDEVERMSELALKEDKQLSIRIRVLPTCQWTFGTDYNVGDVVTLESPDRGSLDLQIYSAEYCRRATGDELYLNLGYECASAPTLIRRTAKENTYARK